MKTHSKWTRRSVAGHSFTGNGGTGNSGVESKACLLALFMLKLKPPVLINTLPPNHCFAALHRAIDVLLLHIFTGMDKQDDAKQV
ncbi:hypothetical protein [Shewanella loihica]|uniref:hypothetical protein n=1 Tax=Shewanella loihica TaxID=359303 RepID=UPI001CBB2001|nr:hypothetical protein [Shewanella loihica]